MTEEETLRETLERIYREQRAYYDELEGESPRAAAILAAAALDDELDSLLRSKFPPDTSNTKWKKISGPGNKPFSSNSAKADVAEVFGFFGSETRKTIELIAQVRNKFAHRTHIRDFDHPMVLAVCRELANNPFHPHTYVPNPTAKDIRWNYITTVKSLTVQLATLKWHTPEIDGELVPLP